jgi:hypothetical protein
MLRSALADALPKVTEHSLPSFSPIEQESTLHPDQKGLQRLLNQTTPRMGNVAASPLSSAPCAFSLLAHTAPSGQMAGYLLF